MQRYYSALSHYTSKEEKERKERERERER